MGSRLARRLLEAGHPVAGYNRTPGKARALEAAGLKLAAMPRAAAEGAVAVFSMVTDDAALLAEKAGIARETAVEALLKSVVASPMVKYRGPYVVGKMPRDAWFNVGMMQKDLQLALDQGHATGVTLPTTALAQQWLTMARGLGLAERDFGTLFDVLAGLSGLPPSPNHDGRASRSRSTGEASL